MATTSVFANSVRLVLRAGWRLPAILAGLYLLTGVVLAVELLIIRAVVSQDALGRRVDGLAVRQIARVDRHVAGVAAEFLLNGMQPFGIDVPQNEAGALLGEAVGHQPPQPAGGARNQDTLVGEIRQNEGFWGGLFYALPDEA